jgi:hypothetical protein
MTPTRAARSMLSLALVAVSLGGAGDALAARPVRGADVLRPNLITLPLGDVSIHRSPGIRELRFSNTVGNRGPGVLELLPVADDCDGDGDPQDDRSAYQRLYGDTDGDGVFTRGVDQPVEERFVGCMLFHPEHDHWHLEDFARYVSVKPATGRVVSAADKVSFCVRDSLAAWSLPGTPAEPYFGECTQDGTTGMSVGWADLYAADLAGQSLDIRGLADGRYCLRSLADPSRRIVERRDDDDRRSVLIRIRGSRVRPLTGPC